MRCANVDIEGVTFKKMFSEKLKTLRKKHQLTQEQLAEKLSVSRNAVAKWESGAGLPDIENIKNIALFFGVSVDYLVGNVTEQQISLAQKFHYAECAAALLGIALGIIAQNFSFGIVVTLLLPSLVLSVEKIVLDIQYQKKRNTVAQQDNLKDVLPKNWYGKPLDTSVGKEGRRQRRRGYAWDSLAFASVMTLFDITAQVFGTDELLVYSFTDNPTANALMSCALSFIVMFALSFAFDWVVGEVTVKKYNQTIEK